MNKQKHPAKQFGDWLREKRQSRSMVARVFAQRIWLSHAKYAEVELGVVKWISKEQESLIPMALAIVGDAKKQFNAMLREARAAEALQFSDIFSRDDLLPIRACHREGKQITKDDEERILNTVFNPLT